jgi:hypothetical protein
MRSLLSFLGVSLLALVACNQTPVESGPASVSVSGSAAPAKVPDEMIHIEDFVERLRAAGLDVSDREEKLHQKIMATDGGRYEVNGDGLEIYEFDTSITSGRIGLHNLREDGLMGQAPTIHKNLALFKSKKSGTLQQAESILLDM